MFNLSGSEMVFLLIIALVVLGPEKLPDAVRKFGKFYGEFKKVSSGFQSELRNVLDEPMREMKETADAMREVAHFDFEPTRVDGDTAMPAAVAAPQAVPAPESPATPASSEEVSTAEPPVVDASTIEPATIEPATVQPAAIQPAAIQPASNDKAAGEATDGGVTSA